MKGLVGLGLSVILGLVFVAATPRGADSALRPAGYRGRIVLQNRRDFTTDLFLQSAVAGGNEMFFGARMPPRSSIAISGLEQLRAYDFDADYDLDGTIDDNLEVGLARKYTLFVYDQ
jgi:hypothetical protein